MQMSQSIVFKESQWAPVKVARGTISSAAQRQTAVTAYLKRKQLLLFILCTLLCCAEWCPSHSVRTRSTNKEYQNLILFSLVLYTKSVIIAMIAIRKVVPQKCGDLNVSLYRWYRWIYHLNGFTLTVFMKLLISTYTGHLHTSFHK